MAATAVAEIESTPQVPAGRASFSSIATKCERCGAQSAIYYFNPFRAFCLNHSHSPQLTITKSPASKD
jgi:hypothetical protein